MLVVGGRVAEPLCRVSEPTLEGATHRPAESHEIAEESVAQAVLDQRFGQVGQHHGGGVLEYLVRDAR